METVHSRFVELRGRDLIQEMRGAPPPPRGIYCPSVGAALYAPTPALDRPGKPLQHLLRLLGAPPEVIVHEPTTLRG